uniref:Uncharacterized protein n=1 Tax=Tanacetum cinerariifolium TaxID=118510 RepID=A0A6L2L3A9_TANCI|nr:hypothetical protein [Tanacetum cinerariifolium]
MCGGGDGEWFGVRRCGEKAEKRGAVFWREALCIAQCFKEDDRDGSREFTTYGMRKGCFIWSVRYLVNIDDFMNPLPEGWSIWSTVWSIVLGEREDDSCLVINLSRKVVQYNLISKTLHEIYDIGTNQLDDNLVDDELIMPFRADQSVYEFIPSSVSV